MTKSIPYTDLLKSYFPGARWADDVELVGSELAAALRGEPKNSELCAAVRWLAGPEFKSRGPLTLRDLVMAVRIVRKDARQADSAPAAECGLCHASGLVELWPNVHGKQASLDAYSYAYSVSTPCGCAAGKKQVEHERRTGSAITDDQYKAIFEQARDQAGDRNRLAVALNAATGVRVEEYARRTARVLESDFAGMEAGA